MDPILQKLDKAKEHLDLAYTELIEALKINGSPDLKEGGVFTLLIHEIATEIIKIKSKL